jgi:cytidine deaminase
MAKYRKIQKERFTEYKSIKEINKIERQLFKIAFAKMKDAYAPYSKFHVGSAVLLKNGIIVGGSNQENASYGLSMCAERTALFNAGSNFPETAVEKLVVVTKNYKKGLSSKKHGNCILAPCGACRQVILEYENRFENDIEILLMDSKGKVYKFDTVKQMLPFAFGGYFLK